MRLLTTLLLLSFLVGCGHKGPLVPLGAKLPAAPDNFKAQQRGDGFLLSWNAPTRNQDDSPLTNLLGFEVRRMDFDSDTPCATCRDTSQQVLYVDLEYLQNAQRSGDLFLVSNDGITPQRAYRYHVIAETGDKRQGALATLDVVAQQPPLPPANLKGEGLDRLVRLSWDEAAVPGADCNLLGYHVYRSEGNKPFPQQPLQQNLVAGTRFEDLGVTNDTPLRYAVRSVLLVGEQEVYSALSEEIVVTPREGR
ncbi:MAG: hypothetical protein C0624_00810 [Desulfuromonas sp.]|nr:MAG: hypothetical protein C0624_00810 [Desulfuromonas sp.]